MLKRGLFFCAAIALALPFSACKREKVYDPYKDVKGAVVTNSYKDGIKRDVDVYRVAEDGTITNERIAHLGYNKKGSLIIEEKLKDNARDGECRAFFNDGTLQVSMFYENGVQEGPEKVYYQNGQLYTDFTYKNGQPDGEATIYHENGQVDKVFHYANGVKIGEERCYFKSGQLNYVGQYTDEGICTGEWKIYNQNGGLDKTVVADENTVACGQCAKCVAIRKAKLQQRNSQ